jgi:hypothetical protein
LIEYDPIGRIMEDLIIATTDIKTECKFKFVEIEGCLIKNSN